MFAEAQMSPESVSLNIKTCSTFLHSATALSAMCLITKKWS